MKHLLQKMACMLITSTMLLASCDNESVWDVIPSDQSEMTTENLFKFKYHGIEYYAEYELRGSTKIFKDEQIGEMLENLENNPNGAILNYPDGLVEFFDSTEEFKEYIKSLKNEEATTTKSDVVVRNYISSFSVSIYEDANYKGGEYSWTGNKRISRLSSLNSPIVTAPENFKAFDNTISSFKFKGSVKTIALPINPGEDQWGPDGGITTPLPTMYTKAILTFYDEEDFRGKAVSYIITADAPEINKSGMGSFNDKASSLIVDWMI